MIYLDNAATTMVLPEVKEVMLGYLDMDYANPSSIYSFARNIKERQSSARKTVADFINAERDEIYFTSGGSESDNWAVKGVADALKDKGNHIITTKIEHHAILRACEFLEKNGFEITYLDVDEYGLVNPKDFEEAIKPTTILASIMLANNEIGTIEPISELGKIARDRGVVFHTDAVQAYGHIPIDVKEMNIDLLSASGHKINGPKGVGILYIRKGINITNLIHGGSQERGYRGGTTNMSGIMGFSRATEISQKNLYKNMAYETEQRDWLIGRVLEEIPYTRVNGHLEKRLSNNASFCFDDVDGEALVLLLDQKGICASTGSACTAGEVESSHVLLALGLSAEVAKGSLRLTISNQTSRDDLEYSVQTIKQLVGRLRVNPFQDTTSSSRDRSH